VRSVAVEFDQASYTLPKAWRPRPVLCTVTSLLRVLRTITRVARRERVQLIHANSAVAGLHALPTAILLRIPCVVYAHDFKTARSTNWLLSILMRYRRSMAIFVSRALVEHYRGKGLLTYPYKVIHNGVDTQVFRPRAEARLRLLQELGLAHNCFLIGSVGRLEPGKGHKVLLDAFARVATKHPHARLVIVGGLVFDQRSEFERELREQIAQLGLLAR
jgi:glycosyltransferase involved in cell wall biosynthesis